MQKALSFLRSLISLQLLNLQLMLESFHYIPYIVIQIAMQKSESEHNKCSNGIIRCSYLSSQLEVHYLRVNYSFH